MLSDVNLWPLIGVAIIIVGFVLRFNPMLVVIVTAVGTALAAGFPIDKILATIGTGFIKTRNLPLIILLPLAVIGLLERHGLRQHAQNWISSIKSATAGRLLIVYLAARQLTAAIGLTSLGGHPQMVRPLLAPMAEGATEARYGKLPSAFQAFVPIFVPILLICLGSIAVFPSKPLGEGFVLTALTFLGQPVVALLVGLALACTLLKSQDKRKEFHDHVVEGLVQAAPILLITGAGGAFGAVLKVTPLGDYLGSTLSALGIGLFMPFVVAAALKSAQGSTTVALVTTSALVAPMLGQLGLDSEMGRVLTVMAIGAGAMTVSHANDSFFWVVTQFSRMPVAVAYRAQTVATLIQGLAGIITVWLLSLVLL